MENELQDNITFFSQITASVTHEITNTLSIMNELNGLFEDQLLAAKSDSTINLEKLKNIHDKFSNQIKRTQSIVKNLNYFSHTIDIHPNQFELIQLLKNIISLSQRFASLSNVNIIEDFNSKSIAIETEPFLFLKLIFKIIQFILRFIEKNSQIEVSLEDVDYHIIIKFQFKYKSFINEEYQEQIKYLIKLAERINFKYNFSSEDNLGIIKIIYNKLPIDDNR